MIYSIKKYELLVIRDKNYHGELESKKITSPTDMQDLLKSYFSGLDREHFIVVAVDARNNVIGINTVSIGSLNATVVHPREAFKYAILANAASVIFAHNHPSGESSPSPEDISITKRLQNAGEILGINVLDSLIFGDSVYSLNQHHEGGF